MTALTTILRGCLAALILGLNTALAAFPIFFLSVLKLLVPVRSWRITCSTLLNRIAEFWVNCNELWLPKPEKIIWSNFDPETLDDSKSCLLTSNHQSWADIFLVQYLLNQRTPQIKFFLKQELIWVPVIGLCWWALDFPFMKRYSKSYLKKHPERKGKDQETTRKACEKFRDTPVAIYNFMEGTRFTPEKQKRQKSPFNYLLKPKAGGAGLVLSAIGGQISHMLNMTIYYNGKTPGFWNLLCGNNGEVTIHIEKREIPPNLLNRDYSSDLDYRTELLQWINVLWGEKDQLLSELRLAAGGETATEQEPETGDNDEESAPVESGSADKS